MTKPRCRKTKFATRQVTRYVWSMNWRDAKGKTMGMSASDIHGLLDDALRFNAVAITFHRENKVGKLPTLEEVQGIFARGDSPVLKDKKNSSGIAPA